MRGAIRIFSLACVLSLLSPFSGCSRSTSGTQGGNPKVSVRLGVSSIPTALTQLGFCAQNVEMTPVNSSLPSANLVVSTNSVLISESVTDLVTTKIPAQTYSKAVVQLSTLCPSPESVAITNGSGSYVVTAATTLTFEGPFEIDQNTSAIHLNLDSFMNTFVAVTSDAALKTAVETITGSVSVLPPSSLPLAWWKLDEGSGSAFYDSITSGITGILGSSVTWQVPGKIGNALSFHGDANSIVDLGNPAALNFGTNSFTYSLWAKISASAPYPNWSPWSKGGYTALAAGYDIELFTGGAGAFISDGTTSKGATFGSETLNQWVLYTVVVDRSIRRLITYKNGSLIGSQDITGLGSLTTANPAQLGARQNGTFSYFNGMIDDVRIYERALSDSEIQQLYADAP